MYIPTFRFIYMRYSLKYEPPDLSITPLALYYVPFIMPTMRTRSR